MPEQMLRILIFLPKNNENVMRKPDQLHFLYRSRWKNPVQCFVGVRFPVEGSHFTETRNKDKRTPHSGNFNGLWYNTKSLWKFSTFQPDTVTQKQLSRSFAGF